MEMIVLFFFGIELCYFMLKDLTECLAYNERSVGVKSECFGTVFMIPCLPQVPQIKD